MTTENQGQVNIYGATYNLADLSEDAVALLQAINGNRAMAQHIQVNLQSIEIAHTTLKQSLLAQVQDIEPVSLDDEATPGEVVVTDD
ncbi:hypothetical protein OAL13_00255 [bacterium]|nr:hypothetical protein [bacterium]